MLCLSQKVVIGLPSQNSVCKISCPYFFYFRNNRIPKVTHLNIQVERYVITAKSVNGIIPLADQITLSNQLIYFDGTSTIMIFTETLGESGSLSVNPNGPSTMVFPF